MKHFVIALGFLLVPFATLAQPAVKLVEYRFETLPSGTGTSAPYFVHPFALASASDVMNGPGLLPIPLSYQQGMSGGAIDKAQWTDHWSVTFDATDYYGITLTPPAGQTLVVEQIKFKRRISSTGPQSHQIRTSSDNFSSTVWVPPDNSSTSWISYSTGILAINSVTPITIRIYGFGSTGPLQAGTFRIDTLQVYGHLQNVFNLPIELTSFTGDAVHDGVMLNWTTATEHNNDYFTVTRSTDLVNWQEVGRVDGAGTSLSELHYNLLDPYPVPGINYYKLRQTDVDEASVESEMISVIWEPPDKLVAFPNPAPAGTAIYLSMEATSITITDAAGRFVPSKLVGREVTFDGPAGTYFILVVHLHGNMEKLEIVTQ